MIKISCFFPDIFLAIFVLCVLNISANYALFVIVSSSTKIISFPLKCVVFAREGFIMLLKKYVTTPSFEIFLKYFLIFSSKLNIYFAVFILLYFAALSFIFLGRVFTKIISQPARSIDRYSQFLIHKGGLISWDIIFFSKVHYV